MLYGFSVTSSIFLYKGNKILRTCCYRKIMNFRVVDHFIIPPHCWLFYYNNMSQSVYAFHKHSVQFYILNSNSYWPRSVLCCYLLCGWMKTTTTLWSTRHNRSIFKKKKKKDLMHKCVMHRHIMHRFFFGKKKLLHCLIVFEEGSSLNTSAFRRCRCRRLCDLEQDESKMSSPSSAPVSLSINTQYCVLVYWMKKLF